MRGTYLDWESFFESYYDMDEDKLLVLGQRLGGTGSFEQVVEVVSFVGNEELAEFLVDLSLKSGQKPTLEQVHKIYWLVSEKPLTELLKASSGSISLQDYVDLEGHVADGLFGDKLLELALGQPRELTADLLELCLEYIPRDKISKLVDVVPLTRQNQQVLLHALPEFDQKAHERFVERLTGRIGFDQREKSKPEQGLMQGILTFVEELERLKITMRTAWTSTGRRESTAEHSFRLALFVYCIQDYFPEVDPMKAVMIALVHDLGEGYAGDISATLDYDSKKKFKEELRGLGCLVSTLPSFLQEQFVDLFLEYNEGQTPEAKLVKAVDKLETIIQHNQGANPDDFDYGFNLRYGKEYIEQEPVIKALRELVDAETKKRIRE